MRRRKPRSGPARVDARNDQHLGAVTVMTIETGFAATVRVSPPLLKVGDLLGEGAAAGQRPERVQGVLFAGVAGLAGPSACLDLSLIHI